MQRTTMAAWLVVCALATAACTADDRTSTDRPSVVSDHSSPAGAVTPETADEHMERLFACFLDEGLTGQIRHDGTLMPGRYASRLAALDAAGEPVIDDREAYFAHLWGLIDHCESAYEPVLARYRQDTYDDPALLAQQKVGALECLATHTPDLFPSVPLAADLPELEAWVEAQSADPATTETALDCVWYYGVPWRELGAITSGEGQDSGQP